MNGQRARQRLRFYIPVLLCSAIGGLLTGILCGCSEHRISLQEFLAMQDEFIEPPKPPATTQPVDNQVIDTQLGPYRVGTGDVLEITLTGLDSGSTLPPLSVRVDREGNIQVPAINPIHIDGLELQDVENVIQKAYVPKVYQDVVAHVALTEPRLTRVLVTGAVTTPGLVQLRRTERNLLFALVAGGGISEAASGDVTLRRIREPEREVTLDLTDPVELRSALAIEPLEDGDVVTANAANPNTVFVGGLVNSPHPQPYPPGVRMSVLQAIAAASGLRTDVTPREGTLIRRKPNGEDVHVKLDLDRITTGKDPNILLAAGDVLWVPDTLETRVQDFINKNFFIRAGATANVNYNVTGLEYLNRRGQQAGLGRGGSLENQLDPLNFLQRAASLQTIQNTLP